MVEGQGELGSAPQSGAIGDRLRAAREARELSIPEVAERTRIPSRHIVAIETGDLSALPAPTYSVGFIKTYARLLGMDPQPLAAEFRQQLAHAAPREIPISPYEPADPARTPSRALAWSSFAVAVLLVLGYLYWRGLSADDPARLAASAPPAPTAAAAPPRIVAPPPPGPAAGVTQAALLTATQQVWIKVYEMGGATLFMGVLEPGDHYALPADAADPRLLTSRPNALDVTVGSTKIPQLGPAEKRIKDVSLKPAALLARAAPTAAPATPPSATPVENSAAPL